MDFGATHQAHGALSPFYRAAARAPVLKRLRSSDLGVRIVTSHYRGQAVDESLRYTLRDVFRRGSVHRYRARGMSIDIHLRHGSSDGNVLQEFSVFRLYDPPPPVRDRLVKSPKILDLGGHIGIFGAHALTLWPDASLVSYEPDPANADLLERTATESGRDWKVVRAAAWTQAAVLAFDQDFAESRIHPEGDVKVDAVDVLPHLAQCDLAKIDIEGAEWTLLADPRFPENAPPTMILECHPADRGVDAESLLTGWGYRTAKIAGAPPGAAMLWAWR